MELHDMAGHLIRRLHQTSTHVFATRTRDVGLDVTPVQFAAMDAIRDNPGIDQAGIAAAIAYDRATIGGVIDRLEQKGWISRTVSPRDRRARVVTLTAEGAAMFDRIRPVVWALQAEILPGLSDEERAQFLELALKASAGAPQP
ncbi:MarR family transcriptional regulator [uncultured Salipiger sp.]|uniref:MarR family winged helix-turn-helix transcriptional regulator n=1 Tax=uncultured Salipiger sp. TaxID=499810 RepID=UPI0025948217|nr:MarR family transcriptional regulator [uncultured Salipiger sp.]